MNNPVELLIVSTNRWNYGGAEKVLFLLLTNRSRGIYNPTVILSRDDRFAGMLREANIPFSLIDFSSCGNALRQMKAFLEKHPKRFQAVLCNSSMAARVMGLLKPWHRLPLIYYAHGKRGYAGQVMLQAMSDRIAAVSRFIASTFPQPSHPGLTVIHNGIPLTPGAPEKADAEAAALRTELALTGRPVVGSVGRLSRVKGYHDLVAAWPAIVRRSPEARLVIAGDGGERDHLEQMTRRLQIEESVIFTGFQARVQPYFKLLDVFVLPSTWQEPFGLVLVEAMAERLPVVATGLGGVPEIVLQGHTGLLVKKNDPEAIAGAVSWLLDHPREARRMGDAGRTRAENLFNTGLMVRKFETLVAGVARR